MAPMAIVSREVRGMFGWSLHGWENSMVLSLIVAGAFALIAGVATWQVVRLQRIEIAESNARQKEAELKLEQLRRESFPRVAGVPFAEALRGQPPTNVKISYVRDAPDGQSFSLSMYIGLKGEGWPVELPEPIRIDDKMLLAKPFLRDMPTAAAVGGQPSGVTIVLGTGTGGIPPGDADKWQETSTPVGALMRAILATVPTGVGIAGADDLPKDTVRIVVAPRP